MTTRFRPMSPHLQVYRFWYMMMVSFLHRATGVALAVGQLLLATWLLALASGPERYAQLTRLLSSPPGYLVLAGFLLAFWYHFCSGIRHLIFDTGRGLEKADISRSGPAIIGAALLLTGLSIWAALRAGGAP